jgi:hypothetical protein
MLPAVELLLAILIFLVGLGAVGSPQDHEHQQEDVAAAQGGG